MFRKDVLMYKRCWSSVSFHSSALLILSWFMAKLTVGHSRLTTEQEENFSYPTNWETFLEMSLGLVPILEPATDQESRRS